MSELDDAVAKLREALRAENDDLRSKIGNTVIMTADNAPDGRGFGTTLVQFLFWTDYRTKIIEAKVDGVLRSVQALAAQAGGAAADEAAKLDKVLAQLEADAQAASAAAAKLDESKAV